MSSTTSKLHAQLCAAVQVGHVDVVRKLLEEDGADPSVPGDDDPTRPPAPVSSAAQHGHVECLKLLLQNNANPNQARTTDGVTPVIMAAANGHVECLKILLQNNANPNQARTTDGTTPVFAAAQERHVECLKMLLENNANPNQAETTNGGTPVIIAAQNGHIECLKLLLQNNASPIQARTTDGVTPVIMASQNGHVECLKILLENNANPNQATTTDGVTPLHAAAGNGELSAAQLLVVHGASIDAVTAFNDTPFSDAAEEGHQHLAEWLNAVATWSPLRVAAALRMHACITCLLQQGRLDPDDRVMFPAAEIMAAIAASTATPAELPWENALPTCQTTIKLVRDASFGWKYSTHQLYHANVKKAVLVVLVVEDRLERAGRARNNTAGAASPDYAPLPLLPLELWLFIVHFFQRSWWEVV
eukprot:gene6879-biopygen15907